MMQNLAPSDRAFISMMLIAFTGAASCKVVDAWSESNRRACIVRCLQRGGMTDAAVCQSVCR